MFLFYLFYLFAPLLVLSSKGGEFILLYIIMFLAAVPLLTSAAFVDLFTSVAEIWFYLPHGNQGGREYVIFTEPYVIISSRQQDLHNN